MAAGRRGGFRDHELREREYDVEVPRKKELYQEKVRKGDQGGRDSRGRDAVRARNRDARERDLVNGSRRSSSSASDSSGGSGNRGDRERGQVSGRSADKEPGELSSGSDDSDSQKVMMSRDNGVQRLVNGVTSSWTGKRKFSPIVWDRDDGKKVDASPSRSNVDLLGNGPLPPPPPLPEGFVPSNSVNMLGSLEHSSPVHSRSPPASRTDEHESNDREPGQLEEEDDFAPARNISSSRWADVGDADEDNETEGIIEESTAKRRKGTPIENSVAPRLYKKAPTPPELGEVATREGSEGAASQPSDSASEDGDAYQEFETRKKDYMDVDGDESDRDISDHQSDADSEPKDDIIKSPSPAHPPQRCINMLQGCRSVDEFERLNKIDEGTYGVVYRARDKKTGEVVALKKVKMEKEREGFPMTSLREINILLSFHHPSIVDVKEVVVGSSLDSIFMVMEYMEHDLKGLMESMKQPFSQSEVKCLMLQLLQGVKYLHDNWVLHRDLKTSNLLFNNRGELKICDFGLSRQYGSPLKPYTHLVVTLWYRAPELLLGMREYSTAIDMWSLGCIMAELLAKEPLFNGKTEFDQLDKIFRILGTPNEKIWPGFSKLPGVKINFVKQPYNRLREKFPPTSFSGRPTLSEKGFDLLNKLLTYDPEKRITAEAALKHEWFTEVPLPKSKDFMPTFPAQHAQDRRLRRVLKSPDPLEEQRRKELQQGEIGTGGLFC